MPAALVGAALLPTAVHLLPTPLPTGVVTGAVGAPYLLWLLATANTDLVSRGRYPHQGWFRRWTGNDHEAVTAELVEEVFGLRCVVVPDPVSGTPMVVPA